MKKSINTLVAAALAASMVVPGCSGKPAESSASESSEVSCAASTAESVAACEESTAAPTISGADEEKGEGVMTYAEYSAAELDSQVTVETYIQAKQGWWENEGVGVATFYTQDADGAYFLYNMPCSEDEYALLTEGTKIKVTGYKSEWSGEIEITDATYEIEDGNYIAEPVDVTDLLASDDLINSQNMLVSFTGMTVEAADDSGAAFLYNYDGSGRRATIFTSRYHITDRHIHLL